MLKIRSQVFTKASKLQNGNQVALKEDGPTIQIPLLTALVILFTWTKPLRILTYLNGTIHSLMPKELDKEMQPLQSNHGGEWLGE